MNTPHPASSAPPDVFAEGGEMGALARGHPWAATPLGPPEAWPQSLRTAVGIVLHSGFPMALWWGPASTQVYNDAFRPILADKHPAALGQDGRACWAEAWSTVGPLFERVWATGAHAGAEDLRVVVNRHGYGEEAYFTFSYSAVRDEHGAVGGVLITCIETTARVVGERRLRTLAALTAPSDDAETADETCARLAAVLAENEADIPFAQLYLFDAGGAEPHLCGSTAAVAPGADAAPLHEADVPHLLRRVAEAGEAVLVPAGQGGARPDGSAVDALALPLPKPGGAGLAGVLVAGLSPLRSFDADPRAYLGLVADHVGEALGRAQAREEHARHVRAREDLVRVRERAAAAVRESEARARLALGVARIGTWAWRPATGEVTADARCREVCGLDPIAPFALPDIAARIHPDDWPGVEEALGRAVEPGGAGRYAREFRFVHADGAVRWVVSQGQTMFDGEGQPAQLIGTVLDVTARRRAEEAAEAERHRLRDLLEQAPVAICVYRGPDHAFELANARYQALFPGRALLGRPLREAIPEAVEQGYVDLLDEVTRTGAPFVHAAAPFEYDRRGDGRTERVFFDLTFQRLDGLAGAPDGVFVMASEVTEQVRAREHLGALLEHAPVALAVLRGPEHRFELANARYRALFPGRALTGRPFREAMHGAEAEAFAALLDRVYRTGEPHAESACPAHHDRDGGGALDEAFFDIVYQPLVEDDAIRGVVVVAVDVTEAVRARQAVEAVAEQNERLFHEAEEAGKAKSAFLANMSHEIRTPLTAILGFAALLARRVDAPNRAYAERIERGGQRLLDTLNAVLTLSRLDADRVEPALVPLEPVVEARDVVELLREQAERKGIALALDVGPGAEHARALLDRGVLASVLHNLVGNAVKFTDRGGVTVRVRAEGDRLSVVVEDTGIGMDPAFLPAVFEAFSQESSGFARSHEGTGLGMSITKRFVELMGGTITVASEKGRGTAFTVSFPRLGPPASPGAPAPDAAPGEAAPRRPRVLIVEDNEDTLALLGELLADTADVHTASAPAAALALADAHGFDLVLLDINLGPHGSGLDVLPRLRERPHLAAARVVALTGYALPGDRERLLAAGFDGYVAKPFDPDALVALVAEA